ncbi:MAG: TonB-dependent receptor [Candidatus Baltobacteraceae bacterium]
MATRHMLRALCAAAIFFAPAFPAFAGSIATPSPSPATLPEIVHVVTSDRSDETLHNATRTTYVVGRDEIARRGFRTVGDALAILPGIEMTRYGPIGQNVSYGIRGSSSSQVLVLIDGVPAPGEFANSVQLGTLSTVGVRRIEVVEGGGSTLYGTGAVGGTINIITDAQYAPTGATLRYGSFNDREFRLDAHGVSFERVVADNAFALPASPGNPTIRDNSDDETTSARFGMDRKIGALGAAFRAGIESDHLGAAGLYPYLSPTSRENDVNVVGSAAFSLDRAQSSTSVQLAGSRQQLAFACDVVNDANCFFPVQAISTESRVDVNFRNTVKSPSHRLIYGIDLSRGNVREDSGAGTAASIATAALAQSAAYVQETRVFRFGDAYAGLRGERDGALGGEFSPSLGIRAEVARDVELKLNAATAFRAPNASELYFPGYGNPALRPERARVGDATLVDHRAMGGVSLGWFTNTTNDLIVAQIVGTDSSGSPVFRPENVDRARMQGLTLDAHTLPLRGIVAGLTVTDLYCAQDVDARVRLPNDPVFAVNLDLVVNGAPRSILEDGGITVRAVGQRSALNFQAPLFAQAGPYSNADAFVRFRIAARTLLALRAYNVGNERYAEVTGYPMPGRAFAVEITTK